MGPLEILAHLAEVGTPPDAEAAARLSAGLEEALGRVIDETFPFIASGGGDLQFVHAPYGRGKTHLLKALEYCARQYGFVTAYVDCRDNQSPFKSLLETYRAIAQGITPPGEHRFFGTSGIAKVIEAQFAGQDLGAQQAVVQRLKADSTLTPDYRNLVTCYCTESVGGEGDEALSESLEALLTATPSYRVTLGELYRKHPHLPRPLGKLGHRNAGVCSTSATAATSSSGVSSWTSVNTGSSSSRRTRARISSPRASPRPRKPDSAVRFALSNDALNTSGMRSFAAISFSRSAQVSTSASLSITHGPAITNSGSRSPSAAPASFTR